MDRQTLLKLIIFVNKQPEHINLTCDQDELFNLADAINTIKHINKLDKNVEKDLCDNSDCEECGRCSSKDELIHAERLLEVFEKFFMSQDSKKNLSEWDAVLKLAKKNGVVHFYDYSLDEYHVMNSIVYKPKNYVLCSFHYDSDAAEFCREHGLDVIDAYCNNPYKSSDKVISLNGSNVKFDKFLRDHVASVTYGNVKVEKPEFFDMLDDYIKDQWELKVKKYEWQLVEYYEDVLSERAEQMEESCPMRKRDFSCDYCVHISRCVEDEALCYVGKSKKRSIRIPHVFLKDIEADE